MDDHTRSQYRTTRAIFSYLTFCLSCLLVTTSPVPFTIIYKTCYCLYNWLSLLCCLAGVGKLHCAVQIQHATNFSKESVIGIEPGPFIYTLSDCFKSTDSFHLLSKCNRQYDPQSLKIFTVRSFPEKVYLSLIKGSAVDHKVAGCPWWAI